VVAKSNDARNYQKIYAKIKNEPFSKAFPRLLELLPRVPKGGNRLPMFTYSMFPCRRDSLEVVGKSTITGKHQLTLPKFVREFLRADNGDLIVFIKDHDKILVKRGTVKIEE